MEDIMDIDLGSVFVARSLELNWWSCGGSGVSPPSPSLICAKF